MRFCLYDRVTEINKGKSIVGIKTYALSEQFHKGHFGKLALVPGVILVETMAQLLGSLINYSHDFKLGAFITLIEGVKVAANLRPGFEARVYGEIISTSHTDSIGRARIDVKGEVIASADRIIYGHRHQVNSAELVRWFNYWSGPDHAIELSEAPK